MMLRRTIHWAAGYLPMRTIMAEPEGFARGRGTGTAPLTPLFERYFWLKWPERFTVYVHHYLRSDPDSAPHDHPWEWSLAFPLFGYVEVRFKRVDRDGVIVTRRWRPPFVPYRMTGDTYHRVICMPGHTSWSVFVHGPRRKHWGFLRTVPGEKSSYVFFEPHVDQSATADSAATLPLGRDQERAPP